MTFLGPCQSPRTRLAHLVPSLPACLSCPAGETHKAGNGMDEKKKKSERKRVVPLLSPNDEE